MTDRAINTNFADCCDCCSCCCCCDSSTLLFFGFPMFLRKDLIPEKTEVFLEGGGSDVSFPEEVEAEEEGGCRLRWGRSMRRSMRLH